MSGAKLPYLFILEVRYPPKNSSSTMGPTKTLRIRQLVQVNSKMSFGYCMSIQNYSNKNMQEHSVKT
jgi:hypothetical protein